MMKRTFILVGVMVLVCAGSAVRAEMVTFDPSAYTSGANELNGQDGWVGVDGDWDTGGAGYDTTQAMRNISPTGTATAPMRRDFGAISAGTITYQLRPADPGADGQLSHWLLPFDSSTSQYMFQLQVEDESAFSDSDFRWRIMYSDSPTQSSGDGLLADQTAPGVYGHWYQVTIAFDVNDNSAGGTHGTFSVEIYDLTWDKKMWDPSNLKIRSDGGNYSQFVGIDRFQEQGSKANGALIDNIEFVPEPMTVFVLGLGALMSVAMKTRRR